MARRNKKKLTGVLEKSSDCDVFCCHRFEWSFVLFSGRKCIMITIASIISVFGSIIPKKEHKKQG